MANPAVGLVIILVAIFASMVQQGLHSIEEGHLGVYYRGGRLLESVAEPGLHVMIPFLTSYKLVQTTLQTDEVRNVPCGTSGGVTIVFERIEVVNQLDRNSVRGIVKNFTVNYDTTLIFNKVHHELNQFCSKHTLQEVYIDYFDQIDENLKDALQADASILAPGLNIQAVRVTKPNIPAHLRENYEKIEAEKTKLMINTQIQKNSEKQAETQRKVALIEAQKIADIAAIKNNEKIAEKEAMLKMSKIEDEQYLAKEKAIAEAEFYKSKMAAEGNELKLTDHYLESLKYEALLRNTKFYFGPSIPSFFTDNSDLKNAITESEKSPK